MSKIIKPHDDAEITVFGFRNIEEGQPIRPEDGGPSGDISNSEENAAPEEAPDPLKELEEIVKNRLFEVERKAEALEKEAYEKGYAQGEKDGFEYGKRNILIVNEHLERILGGLQDVPRKIFQDYREWLISTSIAIARHVLRGELQTNAEAIVRLADAVLDDAEEAHSVTLYLNPADIELMKKHTDFVNLTQREGSSCTFKPDSRLERGGCRLESEVQVINAAVETRVALIEKQLRQHGPADEDPSSP